MTVGEIIFYIFISLFAAIGGVYVYLMLRDIIYDCLFNGDNSNEAKDVKREKAKTVIVYNQCNQCAKERICKYSPEYIKAARKIDRAITCETANITLKCEEFLAKQPLTSRNATNRDLGSGEYLDYVNDGKGDVKPYED